LPPSGPVDSEHEAGLRASFSWSGRDSGAAGFLAKPFRPSALIDTVAEVLNIER
jgi:hypothetical protein